MRKQRYGWGGARRTRGFVELGGGHTKKFSPEKKSVGQSSGMTASVFVVPISHRYENTIFKLRRPRNQLFRPGSGASEQLLPLQKLKERGLLNLP